MEGQRISKLCYTTHRLKPNVHPYLHTQSHRHADNTWGRVGRTHENTDSSDTDGRTRKQQGDQSFCIKEALHLPYNPGLRITAEFCIDRLLLKKQ